MKHYLIPFVPIKGHKDPDFRIPAYGESGQRSITLKNNVAQGSHLFFHTKIGSHKYITGYIVVKDVIDGKIARSNPNFNSDSQYDEWVFIGDPSKSKKLKKPLLFNRSLSERLSLKINFQDINVRTELQIIGSATRSHRELSESDLETLKGYIDKLDNDHKSENSEQVNKYMLFDDETQDTIPFDEVHQLKEMEIQKLIRKNPGMLGDGILLKNYEMVMSDGDRLDIQKQFPSMKVRKMIICDGNISPKLRKACENLDIEIQVYGLKLSCFRIEN